jgi:hypothetical protein
VTELTITELARIAAIGEAAATIAEEQGIPYIAAYVIAGDIASRETADAMLRTKPFWVASAFVGSYARLAWVVDHMETGDVDRSEVVGLLPHLWSGSDPDDTDPRFLALWQDAWRANGRHPVRDGRPLPRTLTPSTPLEVFRGQLGPDKPGIAWTLDPKVARRFALTGGLRATIGEGILIRALAERRDVLAYLTGRGESEVVIDPSRLTRVEASIVKEAKP